MICDVENAIELGFDIKTGGRLEMQAYKSGKFFIVELNYMRHVDGVIHEIVSDTYMGVERPRAVLAYDEGDALEIMSDMFNTFKSIDSLIDNNYAGAKIQMEAAVKSFCCQHIEDVEVDYE